MSSTLQLKPLHILIYTHTTASIYSIYIFLEGVIPIVGCELTPYVLLRRPDKSVSTDDNVFGPVGGHS